MKTTLRKIARLSFALIIPAAFMMSSCQEDLTEPDHATLPKSKRMKPAGTES